MKRIFELQVMKNKKYRTVYKGKESQCYKRLPSVYSKHRIRPMQQTAN